MFSRLAILAAFVASVSAISITSPGTSNNWTNDGSQTVSWTSVVTDATNFTIVLTNTDRTLMPINNQVLKALVQTSTGTTTVDPPSAGWPSVGGNYRVNFCKDSEDLNTIYAQSNPFNITAAPVQSGSSTAATAPSKTAGIANTATSGSGSGSAAPTDDTGASGSATDSGSDSSAPTTTGTSAALPAMGMHSGFIGTLVLLGALLA
ncbi:hypothetical protein C8R44DRAFT_776857 [Mycena epipterygia]|nr:hypothetical protein C8R44DRAFT_776857 [Mycena epipterygia]